MVKGWEGRKEIGGWIERTGIPLRVKRKTIWGRITDMELKSMDQISSVAVEQRF